MTDSNSGYLPAPRQDPIAENLRIRLHVSSLRNVYKPRVMRAPLPVSIPRIAMARTAPIHAVKKIIYHEREREREMIYTGMQIIHNNILNVIS